jgi:hypothetical protein
MGGTGIGALSGTTTGSYCTLDEALTLLPEVASVRTAQQGTTILLAVTAEIDMHLRGAGYAIPISEAGPLASLKTICMNGTAARIAKALWPTSKGPSSSIDAFAALRDDYLAGLTFIDDHGLGAEVATGTGTGSTPVAHGFTDSNGVGISNSPLISTINAETQF